MSLQEHSMDSLHAAATGERTVVSDTRTETRWAVYMARAAERGALSSLSVPLAIDDDVSGALNVCARQAVAFDDDARAAATGFTPYAAVAVRNMRDHQNVRTRARDLEAAMGSQLWTPASCPVGAGTACGRRPWISSPPRCHEIRKDPR